MQEQKKNNSGSTGGSSDQPESDWTIVHFLAGDMSDISSVEISHVTFKTKTGKYYHLQQCNAVRIDRGASIPIDYESRIIYGFADLLDSGLKEIGVETSKTFYNDWDSSEIFKKDPDGRPILFAITPKGFHGSGHQLEHLFATNGEFNRPYMGAANPATILPDGPSFSPTYGLTSICINVPKSQLERVTICTTKVTQKWYLIQDCTSTPDELLKNFSETHYPKLDFSKDQFIFKHETSDNFSCWGDTENDYDLTIK